MVTGVTAQLHGQPGDCCIYLGLSLVQALVSTIAEEPKPAPAAATPLLFENHAALETMWFNSQLDCDDTYGRPGNSDGLQ